MNAHSSQPHGRSLVKATDDLQFANPVAKSSSTSLQLLMHFLLGLPPVPSPSVRFFLLLFPLTLNMPHSSTSLHLNPFLCYLRSRVCKYQLLLLSLQSCPTPCDPIVGSPPGSSVRGILQARILEWVAISLSGKYQLRAYNALFISLLIISTRVFKRDPTVYTSKLEFLISLTKPVPPTPQSL